jgi:hypothetical protein
MGWWPSKVVVLLNIIVFLGYGMIDCVVAGQILSAVANGSMSLVVGIIVVAIIALLDRTSTSPLSPMVTRIQTRLLATASAFSGCHLLQP